MSCDTLEVGLSQNARPQGALAMDARPTGALAMNARPQGDGLCRTFDFNFIPPVVSDLVTFLGGNMESFAADQLVTF